MGRLPVSDRPELWLSGKEPLHGEVLGLRSVVVEAGAWLQHLLFEESTSKDQDTKKNISVKSTVNIQGYGIQEISIIHYNCMSRLAFSSTGFYQMKL